MPESLEEQIERWVEGNLRSVSARSPVSNHLDELLGREIERSEMISLSLRCFALLVEHMRERLTPTQPMLVIPLVSESNKLQAVVPQDLQSIKDQWRHVESPSLYMLDWDASRHLYICEEYRSPLAFDLTDPPIPGVYTYYREFRSEMDIRNDWEFTRCIYAEYYPDRYR